MRRQTILLLAVATVVVGGTFLLLPKAAGIANQGSATSVDILGLTKAARQLPSEQYPAH
jgi:hypothetical protein